MKLSHLLFLSTAIFTFQLLGCSKSGDSSAGLSSISDKIKDVFTPDETVGLAKTQFKSIRDNLNTDPDYLITEADLLVLKTQGIVEENSDLNGWVK